ncbi:unnamed protein product [Brassicogethes aeneus]|uniref:Uncharacterized protein n=1 Tax=Brassicogethes aeneus TaxID=1431903 RepID=A0A9P0B5H4_BRAAE|nr:unnamed protein product [Brassicogethes aeneus]
MISLVCFGFFALLFAGVKCDLNVNSVACGERTCNILEYCSQFDGTCQKCTKICDKSDHNYDQSLCKKVCQDYLHDIRYLRRDDDTIERLSRMVSVCLTLICFILILLAAVFIFQVYRWTKKKNITLANFKLSMFKKKKQPPTPTKPSSTPHKNDLKKPDLRLDMPISDTHSEHSPVTITTSISRRPAEDSALDYAYDNPAMTNRSNPRF